MKTSRQAEQRNHQEIVYDLLDLLTKMKINRVLPEKFVLNEEDYRELMKSPCIGFVNQPPEPPVCAKASWHGGGGLFSSGSSGSYEAKDYHAPEYLRAREKWEETKDSMDSRPHIFGIPIECGLSPDESSTNAVSVLEKKEP